MTSNEATAQYLAGWRLALVIGCLFFGTFLIALDTNILNVAIPKISTDFEALDDIAWYGTSYLVAITAFQPIYGSLYTFFPTTVVYRAAIVIFEIGSIICAAATSSPMFIVGRAIAGLGAAGLLQGALSIISQVVPLQKRPTYMGIVISVFGIATSVGPPLGGAFTEHVTWRWCFWINLPIGAVVLVLLSIFLRIQESGNENKRLPVKEKLGRMDPLGCIIFIGSICCFLFALQWGGQTKPWKSATVIGLLVGAVGLAAVFIGIQWRLQERALIAPRVYKKRSIWTGAKVLFFTGAATYLIVFFIPIYFQAAHGDGPVDSGVAIIPFLLSQIVVIGIVGVIVRHWGHYVPYMIVGECIGVVGMVLLTQLDSHTPTVNWAAYLVIAGLGTGMSMQLPYTAVNITLEPEDIPTGNGIAVLFFQLGGAIAISLGQTITVSTVLNEIPRQLPDLPAAEVVKAGAGGLEYLARDNAQALAILREIWSKAISRTMILAAAVVGASIPFTLGMEWLNAKKVALAKGEVLEEGKDGEKRAEDQQGLQEEGKAGEVRKEPDHVERTV